MNTSSFRRPLPLVLLSFALALPAAASVGVDGREVYVPTPAPRIDLRALRTAKSFNQFIVRYHAGSAPASDRGALDATLQRAAVRAQDQLKRERADRGIRISEPAWTVRSLRQIGRIRSARAAGVRYSSALFKTKRSGCCSRCKSSFVA